MCIRYDVTPFVPPSTTRYIFPTSPTKLMYTVLSTRCQLCFRNAWIVPPSSEIDGYLVAHASQFTTSKLIIFDLGGCRVVLCGRVTLRERIVWFMGGGEICWHDERNKLRSRDNSTLLFPSSEMFELILTEFNFMLREIWTMTALAVGIHVIRNSWVFVIFLSSLNRM